MDVEKHAVIVTEEWTYECGDIGCCSDYGTNLYINDELID